VFDKSTFQENEWTSKVKQRAQDLSSPAKVYTEDYPIIN